ncbi:hypothetical protein [Azospirillum largimobile]
MADGPPPPHTKGEKRMEKILTLLILLLQIIKACLDLLNR